MLDREAAKRPPAARRAAPLLLGDPAPSSASLAELPELLAALWRGRLWIALVATLAVLAGGVYAFRIAQPLYSATTVVILESREARVAGLEAVLGGLSGDSSVVNTEVEVLRGRELIGRAVDRLDLVRDPEFNAALRSPGALARLRAVLARPSGPGTTDLRGGEQRERDATITALLERLTVRNVPNSLVFQITAQTGTPEKSAAIADMLAALYIEDQLRVKREATERATQWLTERVSELRADLEASETAVREFRGAIDLVDAATLSALDRQLKDTRERLAAAEAQAATARLRSAALAAAEGAGREARALAAEGDPVLARLAPSAGTDPEAAAEFDRRFDEILAQARQEALRAAAQAEGLVGARDALEAQIERQSSDLIRLEQLSREAESSKLIFEHFLTRLKETAVQQGIQQADSRVLSGAVVPVQPAAPRKALILALSALFGFVAGGALVIWRETRAQGLRTARDLEALTGRTVLGQVPRIRAASRDRALAYLAAHPTSAAAEAVRNLRTSLLLSDPASPPQVIMLSSSVPGEGKTTLTLALAQNLAAMGKRVLVIEGDVRRRVFGESLGMHGRHGLIAVLEGRAELASAVQRAGGLGDVLVGEASAANPADLFSSPAFAALLAEARARYEIVLIDTPPVLVVPDARVIGQAADAILFVVQWDRTRRRQVEEALRLFETVNLGIAGLALSQIRPEGMRRYGQADSYGAFAGYGRAYYGS